MTASQVAWVCAVGAAAAWAAKAVAIALAGGLGQSAAEDPLFFLGLVCVLVGVVALGLAVSAGRPVVSRVVVFLAAVAAVIVTAGVLSWLVSLVEPDDPSWVWGEVNLWLLAAVLLAAVALHDRVATPARS